MSDAKYVFETPYWTQQVDAAGNTHTEFHFGVALPPGPLPLLGSVKVGYVTLKRIPGTNIFVSDENQPGTSCLTCFDSREICNICAERREVCECGEFQPVPCCNCVGDATWKETPAVKPAKAPKAKRKTNGTKET